MSFLLLAGCGNNKQTGNMAITVNLRYTGADMPETDNQFIRH